MGTPLDDVEYLARSANRVRVLETLAKGPHDRTDLQEKTGAARATLGRILGEFEERGWIRRDGAEYELMPLSDFLATRPRYTISVAPVRRGLDVTNRSNEDYGNRATRHTSVRSSYNPV